MIPATLTLAAIALSAGLASAAPAQVQLPPLPYDYNALVPIISEDIMRLHHDKHHAAQVVALNDALAKFDQITGADDQSVLARVKLTRLINFNGGGNINHAQFWPILSPLAANGGKGGVFNDGPLKQAITNTFGSVDNFKFQFGNTTLAIQGSGWGWLGYDSNTKELSITTTPNQDPLVAMTPIIGIDVFEHAYYLDYKNERNTYLIKIWDILNWEEADKRYQAAVAGK